jgi:hypothetical protein
MLSRLSQHGDLLRQRKKSGRFVCANTLRTLDFSSSHRIIFERLRSMSFSTVS